jgi:aminopeptidase N
VAAPAVAEITQAETQRRARLLTVRSYEVDLDLTRGEVVFGSRTVLRFDCTEPGEQVHADLIAAAVHAIALNGQALDPALVYANGRIALPGLAASNELVVLADCAYTTSDWRGCSASAPTRSAWRWPPGHSRRLVSSLGRNEL